LAARIYTDKDVDLRWLKGKTCAVIGFGAQGHAHALNLRDSGVKVIVGLYPGSKSRARAKRSDLKVLGTVDAARRGDIIFLALPDTQMPAIYAEQIAPNLRSGQTLLFAHGFAIYYRTIVPRRDVDVVMVAPKGLGAMVRREFLRGRGVPGLIAVHQNPSRHARQTALAWAKGIGCARAGVLETTFREETETDLFGEQAVLCGGTSALIRAGFETLVGAGYPPELAYFECLHELKFIVDLIQEAGIGGRSEDYRPGRAKTDERGAAGDPLRKICARIYSGNENWPTALHAAVAGSRKTSDRESGRTPARPNELEGENKKQLVALPGWAVRTEMSPGVNPPKENVPGVDGSDALLLLHSECHRPQPVFRK